VPPEILAKVPAHLATLDARADLGSDDDDDDVDDDEAAAAAAVAAEKTEKYLLAALGLGLDTMQR